MIFKNSGTFLCWTVLGLALVFSGALVGRPSQEPDGGGIAFVNLSKVLNAYKGLMGAEDEINAFLKAGDDELKKAEEELTRLNNELMVYSSESAEYQQGKNEIERKELQLKQRKRSLLAERDQRLARHLRAAYTTIEQAITDYRVQRNLRAVLACNEGIEKMDSQRPEDLLKWISMVEVVSFDDRLDISDAIITIINGS